MKLPMRKFVTLIIPFATNDIDKKPTSNSEHDDHSPKRRRETITSEEVEDLKGYGSPDEEVDQEDLVKNIVTRMYLPTIAIVLLRIHLALLFADLVRHVEILKAKIRLARLNRSSTAYLEEQLMVAKARLTAGNTCESNFITSCHYS
jgi:hypothetical protein